MAVLVARHLVTSRTSAIKKGARVVRPTNRAQGAARRARESGASTTAAFMAGWAASPWACRSATGGDTGSPNKCKDG